MYTKKGIENLLRQLENREPNMMRLDYVEDDDLNDEVYQMLIKDLEAFKYE